MKKVLIAYISRAGHTKQMADYIAEGVRMTGCEAELKTAAAIKTEKDLAGYDGCIFGSPDLSPHHAAYHGVISLYRSAGRACGQARGRIRTHTRTAVMHRCIFSTPWIMCLKWP